MLGVQGPLLPTGAAGPQGGTRRRTSSCHPRVQARCWVPGGVESFRSFPLAPEKPPFPRHCPLVDRSSDCRSEPPGTRDLECRVLAPKDCAPQARSSPLAPGDARRGPEVALAGDEQRVPGSGSALRVATHPQHCAGSRTPLPALPQGPLQPSAGLPGLAALSQAGRATAWRARGARGRGARVARSPLPGGRAPSCPLTTCRGAGASAPRPKLALRVHPSMKFSDPPDSLIWMALQSSNHPNPVNAETFALSSKEAGA